MGLSRISKDWGRVQLNTWPFFCLGGKWSMAFAQPYYSFLSLHRQLTVRKTTFLEG